MKTYLPTEKEIQRKWYLVDADDRVLGRLAVRIANVLRGRHKPMYTPHLDTGDFIVVVNASKVRVTGNKETGKTYDTFSGYMSGLKTRSVQDLRQKHPERLIELAVWGMMPHTRMGRRQFRKLKVFPGASHDHAAQKPEPLQV